MLRDLGGATSSCVLTLRRGAPIVEVSPAVGLGACFLDDPELVALIRARESIHAPPDAMPGWARALVSGATWLRAVPFGTMNDPRGLVLAAGLAGTSAAAPAVEAVAAFLGRTLDLRPADRDPPLAAAGVAPQAGRTLESDRAHDLRWLYAALVALDTAEDADVGPVLQRIVELLPAMLVDPARACARIAIEGVEQRSARWGRLACRRCVPVRAREDLVGELEVGYQQAGSTDPTPLLAEAAGLIDAVAARIGEAILRRRTRRELARREVRYRLLIENSTDVVSLTDGEGVLLYVSPSIERVLGYRPMDLVGSSVWPHLHEEDGPPLREQFRRAVVGQRTFGRAQFRARHVDGSYRWLESLASDRLHAIGGVVINLRDVTERRQLEEQLAQSQKLEAVGRLAGGIAHDFNNLLTVIQVSSALLLGSPTLSGGEREDVEEIGRAAKRASALTRQLLAFSRRQIMRPVRLDLNTVVADMEKMLRRVIGEDVDLTTRLDRRPVVAIADPAQVEQVVMNLAVNAREAMPQGGRLTISTELEGADAGGVDRVHLEVRDTGLGMPPEVRDRVFEPFFTTKASGTGLGLATVFGIVKQSGGSIEVESEVGVGTVFRVSLPAATEGQGSAAFEGAVEADGAPTAGGETILVVEDDAGVRAVARRILRREGYLVLEAAEAAVAERLAAEHAGPISLLLIDVVLPGVSGPALAGRLAAARRDLRVLYMSGYTDDHVSRHGIIERGVELIDKPFTPDALLLRVRKLLSR